MICGGGGGNSLFFRGVDRTQYFFIQEFGFVSVSERYFGGVAEVKIRHRYIVLNKKENKYSIN